MVVLKRENRQLQLVNITKRSLAVINSTTCVNYREVWVWSTLFGHGDDAHWEINPHRIRDDQAEERHEGLAVPRTKTWNTKSTKVNGWKLKTEPRERRKLNILLGIGGMCLKTCNSYTVQFN